MARCPSRNRPVSIAFRSAGGPTPAPEVPVDPYQAAVQQTKNRLGLPPERGQPIGPAAPARGEPVLLPLLDDARRRVRAAAANALGTLRANSAVPKISELLRKDADSSVRGAAAAALAYIRDSSAANALIARGG